MKPGHWAALGAAVALTVWLVTRVIGQDRTGGFGGPPKQAVPENGGTLVDPHPEHPVFCQPEDHVGGVIHTRHRYPATAGGEISAAIHRGWSPMRVPARTPGAQWIVAPPSEETL